MDHQLLRPNIKEINDVQQQSALNESYLCLSIILCLMGWRGRMMDQASEERPNRTGLSGLWLIRELRLCPSSAAAPSIPQHFLQSKPGHSALISHWERRQATWFKAGSIAHTYTAACALFSPLCIHALHPITGRCIVIVNVHSDDHKKNYLVWNTWAQRRPLSTG